jgi:hypothetical protein
MAAPLLELELESRRALVRRVLASEALRRAVRLRDLLRYLAERKLADPPEPVIEADIAITVLERREFDQSAANLLRTHISFLRKKLKGYFATEGVNEMWTVEVAPLTYDLVFSPRAAGPVADDSRPRRRGIVWGLSAACAVLALTSGFLLVERGLHRRPGTSASPRLERFWRQLFDNGQPTTLLLADSGFTLVQDLMGTQLPLADYQQQRLNALIPERIQAGPEWQSMAHRMLFQQQTPIADVTLAGRVWLLHSAYAGPVDVILARDAAAGHFESRNVIVSGPRRGNPWLELFEPHLNFVTRFDEATKRVWFENRAPQAGEAATYSVEWGKRGYCRVAYLRNQSGSGTILLVSGSDLGSTEAGALFITTESWIGELRTRLGLKNGEPFPQFEVLLGCALVTGRATGPELLAHRILSN